jgi:hypothetical protein
MPNRILLAEMSPIGPFLSRLSLAKGYCCKTPVETTRDLRSYSHVKHASDLHPDTGVGGFRLKR